MENKYFEEGESFVWERDVDREEAPLRLHLIMERERFRNASKQAMVARDRNTGKRFFLKILFCSDIDQVFVEKESKVKLFSPYVIRIYGGMLDDVNKRFITAMEYIDELDLSDMISQRGLKGETWNQKLSVAHRIAMKFLEGISYYSSIYEEDPYVHRDLKPENVLASTDGSTVKIIDFDWVHLHDSRVTIYSGREQKGTAGYADPAYWSSSICKKGMDIYSAGLVLYFLYTGRHHFHGNEEIQKYMEAEDYAYTLKPMPGIDDDLYQIIAKMICREEARYRDIRDVIRDFRQYLSFRGIRLSLPEMMEEEASDEIRISYKINEARYTHYLKNYRFVPVIFGRKQVRSQNGADSAHILSFYRMNDVIKVAVFHEECKPLRVQSPEYLHVGDRYQYAGATLEVLGIRQPVKGM